MKKYLSSSAYCRETGFPVRSMRELVHSNMSDEFCHRSSGARNATILIDVEKFEKMWDRGEFKGVLES